MKTMEVPVSVGDGGGVSVSAMGAGWLAVMAAPPATRGQWPLDDT